MYIISLGLIFSKFNFIYVGRIHVRPLLSMYHRIIGMDFEVTSHLLTIYCAFIIYLEKWEQNEAVHQQI